MCVCVFLLYTCMHTHTHSVQTHTHTHSHARTHTHKCTYTQNPESKPEVWVQKAACEWLKSNPSKWQQLVKFPERNQASPFCSFEQSQGALCTPHYVRGWVCFYAQIALSVILLVWSSYLKQPSYFPDDESEARKILEAAMKSGQQRIAEEKPLTCNKKVRGWFKSIFFSKDYENRTKFVHSLWQVPIALTHKVRTRFVAPSFHALARSFFARANI